MLNALTVDVEDYFQVSAFADQISISDWDSFPSRVVESTHRVLRLFDRFQVRATFFMLGWTAERFPQLVRDIASAGHELGNHSYHHRLVYDMTPDDFRNDLRLASAAIGAAAGQRVDTYRAPSFSITGRSLWALDVLIEEGFRYDSSIFPIHHDRYGIPGAERFATLIERERGNLWEFPPSVRRVGLFNAPVGGGGYLRLYPRWLSAAWLQHINCRYRQPFMFYIHPWEFDPEQPRLPGRLRSRFRHRVNLHSTEDKVRSLLERFKFATLTETLSQRQAPDDGAAAATPAPIHIALPETAAEPRNGKHLHNGNGRQNGNGRPRVNGHHEKAAPAANAAPAEDRPRVLYLVHRFPYPPDKGDRIRAFNVIKYLGERCRLDVATLADEPYTADSAAALRQYCERLEVAPLGSWTRWPNTLLAAARGRSLTEGALFSPALAGTVRRWAAENDYDAVLTSSSAMAQYRDCPSLRDVPTVVDLVDVDSEKWVQYSQAERSPKRLLYGFEARRLRRLERRLLSVARAVTLVSENEAELCRTACGKGPIVAVPNGVDLDYFSPRTDVREQKACVFVGAMDYKPNVDAVTYFVRDVWPQIHGRHPDSVFQIVGRRPAAAVKQLARVPGVEVVGAVPDVRDYVTRAAVTVAPLRIARGIQNKVLEAMALARPVVASPHALSGLAAQPDEHLLVAAFIDEWVDCIDRLFTNENERTRLGRAAREYVVRYHNWNVQLAPFGEMLHGVNNPQNQTNGHWGPALG